MMRLWHEKLIPELPQQQLLRLHRECCVLRSNAWKKRHSMDDYVFEYSPYKLYQYHMKVMNEMKWRGYRNDPLWESKTYRGKNQHPYSEEDIRTEPETSPIYPEHDTIYLKECLYNLAMKGIRL